MADPNTCTAPWHTPLVNTEGRIAEPWALYFACLERKINITGFALVKDDGGIVSGGTGCPVSAIFQGREVCLSPFPLLDNAISGEYMLAIYNFLQSVPGAWEFGCIQPSTGYYIWPVPSIDPRPGLPIPPEWVPYLEVSGCIAAYFHTPARCGNFIIHRDTACDF
jgi:hypothetical protein